MERFHSIITLLNIFIPLLYIFDVIDNKMFGIICVGYVAYNVVYYLYEISNKLETIIEQLDDLRFK
jgi:hypothetical protein